MLRRRLGDSSNALSGWAVRKLAGSALAPDDVLLDLTEGRRLRFWDSGTDEPVVTPKRRARAVPLLRGLTIVTYTRTQLLFLADGFGRNCALEALYRVDEVAENQLAFIFARPESKLSILELKVAGSLNGFPERLLTARDEARRKFRPEQRAELARIDRLIGEPSIDQIRRDWPSRGT